MSTATSKPSSANIAEQHLVPVKDFTKFIRSVYVNRVCIGLVIASWLFTSLFAPGDRVEVMNLTQRLLYNGVWGLAYYAAGYAFIGAILYRAMMFNIPFVWTTICFYAVMAGVETTAFQLFFVPQASLVSGAWYWLTTLTMIVISVVAVVAYFERTLRQKLSSQPDLVPLWKPVRHVQCKLEAMLPAEIRAPIRRIEAQNQYIHVVTEKGDTLLRLSLTKAEECLPEESGLRIHRSIWIRKSDLNRLVFRDGNPRVVDQDASEFPVSRKMVGAIRTVLADSL